MSRVNKTRQNRCHQLLKKPFLKQQKAEECSTVEKDSSCSQSCGCSQLTAFCFLHVNVSLFCLSFHRSGSWPYVLIQEFRLRPLPNYVKFPRFSFLKGFSGSWQTGPTEFGSKSPKRIPVIWSFKLTKYGPSVRVGYRYLAVTSCEWRRFSSLTSLSLSYSSGTDPVNKTKTLHYVALKVELFFFFDIGILLTVMYRTISSVDFLTVQGRIRTHDCYKAPRPFTT